MRIDKVYIENFKNLNQFNIDLDTSQMHTVLLGQNAAGKSNFLEALVIIFRDLDLREKTEFDYELEYECKGNLLKVVGGPKVKGKFQFYRGEIRNGKIIYGDKPVAKKEIDQNRDNYLPKYVFSYYSGISNRLLQHFDRHQLKFYNDLLKGEDDPFRPLFYARSIHSYFVLLAFYAFKDLKIKEFLKEYLNIVGLESILFVLKKPDWPGDTTNGDKKFWYAKGVVKDFLNELWDAAICPIYHKSKVREDFNKHPDQEQLYLFISNQESLEELASKYLTNTEFFKRLESTYMSDLIQEVRVKVKKSTIKGDITFKELSEGEQQLLTVLGLLRFTKEQDALILLDEPDTHLNPLWKWKYMSLLNEYSDKEKTSQIIMTTHDPLVIGGLTKKEIRVFYSEEVYNNKSKSQIIKTFEPELDPKGMGVAGILTSDFFNLPSSMDEASHNDLVRKRELEVLHRENKLSEDQKEELQTLIYKLNKIGLGIQRDPLYERFIEAVYKNPDLKKPALKLEDKKKQDEQMAIVLKQLMDEDKIQ